MLHCCLGLDEANWGLLIHGRQARKNLWSYSLAQLVAHKTPQLLWMRGQTRSVYSRQHFQTWLLNGLLDHHLHGILYFPKKVDFTSTWTKIYNNMQKMHHDLSPHEKLIQIISCYNCIQWCEIGWLLHALTDVVLCCPWMQKGNLQPSLLCKQTEEWLMS